MVNTPDDPNQAQAWISGTPPDQTIDFYIPRGNTGPMGPRGPIGPSLAVGSVETVTGPAAPGTVGPQGLTGPKGDPGGIVLGTTLGTNDLNLIIAAGTYYQNDAPSGTLARNYPRDVVAGNLVVFQAATSNLIKQIFYPINASHQSRLFYVRQYNTSAWTPWTAYGSQRVDQTAGRVIYQWDDVNNRDQMTFGDTGWRDVSPMSGTAGWVRLRRIQNIVYVWAGAWVNGTSSDILALPVGFQTGTNSFVGQFGDRSGSPVPVNVNGPSSLIQAPASATALSFLVSFPTVNAWPTSLPGAAHAAIPSI